MVLLGKRVESNLRRSGFSRSKTFPFLRWTFNCPLAGGLAVSAGAGDLGAAAFVLSWADANPMVKKAVTNNRRLFIVNSYVWSGPKLRFFAVSKGHIIY